MKQHIILSLAGLFLSLGLSAQGLKVLLLPQEPLVETRKGQYDQVYWGKYVWGSAGSAGYEMKRLSERIRLISQGRIGRIHHLPDGDAIDFQACLYRTEQVWEDTLTLQYHGLHTVVLELVEAWSADSIRARSGLRGKRFRKAGIGPVLSSLTGGRLREGKAVRRGRPMESHFDGLRPYTYEGKRDGNDL